MLRSLACALVLLLSASPAAAAAMNESLDMTVPQAPAPFRVEGRQRLMYELHLTNFSAEPVRLQRVEALDRDGGAVLASFAGAELGARRQSIGQAATADAALRPGERVVVFVEFDLAAGAAPPTALRHRIGLLGERGEDEVEGAPVAVAPASTLLLGPPLRGGPWAAVHAPQWPRGHRRVFYTLDGRARLPGRHAIDWVAIDSAGRRARGDADRAANSLGYGADVLAVADAQVVAARDGIAESATLSGRRKHSLDQAPGNYLVLALADGRYATYEHLRPGSLRVRVGERVRRGQTIAALGFTGDSTGPHLHFHVADGARPLASEGLPFEFERFERLGAYPQIDRLGRERWQAPAAGAAHERRGEAPASNSVVMFAE
ncbi:peptidoglycan DD-metalloendopeptidase family protein [Lysobacter sp. BMK333-48F3]|uniref:peptidoglycan DD-metalloendopeptidase family protein n=1 Tax=Lysobacter sp. BMK333-48F3 TaxID=2867962 RepID=UPI001C8B8940|nr:peptidoglycan DD-metalloendopeptidase family protein [Lysobacter sp. BMK333-48F3]MBX9400304.1 peptidoglycan DD-metalloendopeptidase family protein [Lysobacter sp. BMK333-48F3]